MNRDLLRRLLIGATLVLLAPLLSVCASSPEGPVHVSEVPYLDELFPLRVVPSAYEGGTLLLANTTPQVGGAEYYWLSPGKPPKRTGIEVESEEANGMCLAILVLNDGSIIYQVDSPSHSAEPGSNVLARQESPGSPLDFSFGQMFPDLAKTISDAHAPYFYFYPTPEGGFVLQASTRESFELYSLVPDEPAKPLDISGIDAACCAYAPDLSLVLFAKSGDAYRLDPRTSELMKDELLSSKRPVPFLRSPQSVIGRYLVISHHQGIEGIPLQASLSRFRIPDKRFRDSPADEAEMMKTVGSDEAYRNFNLQRKRQASRAGPNFVSGAGPVVPVSGKGIVADSFLWRVLLIEPGEPASGPAEESSKS